MYLKYSLTLTKYYLRVKLVSALLMEDNKFLDVVMTSLPLFGANVFTFKVSFSTVSVLSKLVGVTVCGVT